MRKLLVLSPEVPNPIFKGNQHRIDLTISSLIEIGLDVDLICLNANQKNVKSYKQEEHLKKHYKGINQVHVIKHPRLKSSIWNYINKLYDFTFRKLITTSQNCPLNFVKFARKAIKSNNYDILLVNYLKLSNCVPNFYNGIKIVDLHDIHSIIATHGKDKSVFLRYFENELLLIDTFDYAISINQNETKLLGNFIAENKLLTLSACNSLPKIRHSVKRYDLGFIGSSSFFNIEAVMHFNAKVLPKLKLKFPNIQIAIAGDVSKCKALEKLDKKIYTLQGRVDSVGNFYESIKVFISPVINGAGMKVKNIEAMSYAMPIVATRFSMDGIAYKNGKSCLVSSDWSTFSENIVYLLEDKNVRIDLGNQAREFQLKYHSQLTKINFFKNLLSGNLKSNNYDPSQLNSADNIPKIEAEFSKGIKRTKALIFGTDAYTLSSYMINLAEKLKSLGIYSEFFKMESYNKNQFYKFGYIVHSLKERFHKYDRKKYKKQLEVHIKDNKLAEDLFYQGVNVSEDFKIYMQMFPSHFTASKSVLDSLAHIYIILDVLNELIDKFKPDFLVGWNGNGPHAIFLVKIIAKVKNIPVFHSERGLLPNSIIFDPLGVNNKSFLAGAFLPLINDLERNRAKIFLQKYRSKFETIVFSDSKSLTEEEFIAKYKFKYGNRYVFFPMQIEGDSNIILNSPYFKKMEKIITLLAKVCQNLSIDLICKPHPENLSKINIDKLQNKFDNLHIQREGRLENAINFSTCVIVVNSTVGLEILLLGKPTIALGHAFYTSKGITYDCANESNLKDTITSIINSPEPPNMEYLYRLIYFLTEKYLIFLDAPNATQEYKLLELLSLNHINYIPNRRPIATPKLAEKYINDCDRFFKYIEGKKTVNILSELKPGTRQYLTGAKKVLVTDEVILEYFKKDFPNINVKLYNNRRKDIFYDIAIVNEGPIFKSRTNIRYYINEYMNLITD